MIQTSKRTTYYNYPVELVWRAICGGSAAPQLDPITEEEFDSTEPEEGTMFTRVTQMEVNKVFALRMKTREYTSDLRIELSPAGTISTKMDLEQSVEYRTKARGLIPALRFNLSRETKEFSKEILRRLKASMEKAH